MVSRASFAQWCARSVVAGALLAVAAGAAEAQLPLPSGLAWPGLTQDNLDRMHAAAARLYEGRSIGTVERWRNPTTNDAGEVTLVRSFDAHGMPCRTLDYTIRFETARNSPTHYLINWCRIQGGEWKIVELVPPR